MTPFLRLGSLLLLVIASCAAPYARLKKAAPNAASSLRFRPEFKKVLYRCVVDGRFAFRKFHLSGLLFFKAMDDGATRAVFQNEMGFTFFDFEWNPSDSFMVHTIIPQLNKAALVKTLQKDMNLLLMKQLDTASEISFSEEGRMLHRFSLEKGFAYYIANDSTLERIENVGQAKVVTIRMSGKANTTALPDAVVFQHHKANFTIRLNKISNAEE